MLNVRRVARGAAPFSTFHADFVFLAGDMAEGPAARKTATRSA